MARTYGRLWGGRGEVTRTGGMEGVGSKLETWNGSIRTVLRGDGEYWVHIGSKSNPSTLVVRGNVDSDVEGSLDIMDSRTAIVPDGSVWIEDRGMLIPAESLKLIRFENKGDK